MVAENQPPQETEKDEREWDQLTARLPKALLNAFRVRVAEQRDKMTPVIAEAIEDYLRRTTTEVLATTPLDSLSLDDLNREQREMVRIALIAIRRPDLNLGTFGIEMLLRSASKRPDDFMTPSAIISK